MRFKDLIEIIWKNMWKRRTRTIFTMLGVIIGCLAVFIISSITHGFEGYLTTEMEGLMDTSVISVYPNYEAQMNEESGNSKPGKSDSKTVLNDKSVKELEKLEYLIEVIPMRYAYSQVEVNKIINYGRFLAVENFVEKEGELLAGRNPRAKSREVIIGYEMAKQLLGFTWEDTVEDDAVFEELVGKKMTVGGESFGEDEKGNELKSKKFTCKIVGVISSASSGMDPMVIKASDKFVDDIIKSVPYYDEKQLQETLTRYDEIKVRVDDKEKLGEYEGYLRELGYQTSSFKDFENQTKNMIMVVSLVLGSLAGISLLVAALGITNTMDMAIYERNKEIGVMKVIGGSLTDIRKIFVGEACAIAVTGGVISIILGLIIDVIINKFAGNITQAMMGSSDIKIAIPTVTLIIGILAFCLVIGFIAGILPANKAAKTDVISAIR